MKQVVDRNGGVIKGLFRTESGSILVDDPSALQKSQLSQAAFESLSNEVQTLKNQINEILKHIHG